MSLLGKPCKRIDGYEKVSGKAEFGSDLKFQKMLYAACRYSDIPAGKITDIDTETAKKNPDVKAIALYDDVPGDKRVGPIRKDYYPIVKDEVFFSGDVIAVVAAKSKEDALKAANDIKVVYQQYEPVTDIQKAVLPDSRLVHSEYESNIVVNYPLKKGNSEEALKKADHIIERQYNTGFQEHAYIEPETVTVIPDTNSGGYTIFGSIQNPYTTRKVVSDFMGIPLNRIAVKPSTLGGSFGGKDDVINNMACRTTLLCKMTGKPVQMTNSREISMRESYKRHPYHLKYKAGYSKTGRITALEIELLADSGAYSSQTFFVTWRSLVQASGPYDIPNISEKVMAVYTNNSYTAAFRGFGSPQVIFAIESLLDEIADKCNITPLEIRRVNALRQDSINATGQKLSEHKVSLIEVMAQAAEKSDFLKKREFFRKQNEKQSRFKKGIGLAVSYRGCSLGAEGTDTSSAIVSVQADGSVILLTGVTENGQGLRTAMSLIAAEELGIALDDIVFLSPNTSQIADGGPTVASRGTIAGGNAVKNAAGKIKEAIFPLIKEKLSVKNISDTTWKDGKILSQRDVITFKEAVALGFSEGVNLSAYGWFKAPPVSWNEDIGQGDAYFTYVYGCQVAEISVDTYTGKINVDHVTAAHDLGKVINLIGALGQVYGGVLQGMGYAVTEEFSLANGNVLTSNFDTYLIPTIKDMPEMDAILVENPDKAGPLGAKSLGEPTLEMIAAAVNNALHNAAGRHSYSLPISMEEVYLSKKLIKKSRMSMQNKENSFKHSLIKIDSSFTPRTLEAALNMLHISNHKIIAGGTDVLIDLRNSEKSVKLINLKCVHGLSDIKITDDKISIGAAADFTKIINNKLLQEYLPVFVKACSMIGSTQIRNQATLAGNIVNAAPCADSVPPLLLENAVVNLQTQYSKRTVPLSDFILNSYKTVIKDNEILTSIEMPFDPHYDRYKYFYYQLGRRNALNITRMSIAAKAVFNKNGEVEDIRISAGSLLKTPARLHYIENLLLDKKLAESLINTAVSEMKKLLHDKIGSRWSAEYKIPVFCNLLKYALENMELQRRD